jgi:hypothetical protein
MIGRNEGSSIVEAAMMIAIAPGCWAQNAPEFGVRD